MEAPIEDPTKAPTTNIVLTASIALFNNRSSIAHSSKAQSNRKMRHFSAHTSSPTRYASRQYFKTKHNDQWKKHLCLMKRLSWLHQMVEGATQANALSER
jgi:hypothetical protein